MLRRNFARWTCAAWAVGAWMLAIPATAQTPEQVRIESVLAGLNAGRGIGQVAVSPDGQRLAWVERAGGGAEIRVARLDAPQRSERVTAAAKADAVCDESQLAWSPDARTLAFFSDCADPGGQTQLYLSALNGEPARQLTIVRGEVDAPAFSPDGTKIGFLYVEGATRKAGALAAMKPWSGVIGEEGIEVQRVAVASVNAAQPAVPQWATPSGLHVYEFDWRPDSKGLAYVAADPPGENNWWVAKLYTQTLGAAARVLLDSAQVDGPLHGLQIAVPRWSPDGKRIALIGGLMSDQGSTGGDVWRIDADGGAPVAMNAGRTATTSWLEWADAQHVYATELAGGEERLVRYTLGAGAAVGETIFSRAWSMEDGRLEMSLSASADHGTFAFRASSFAHAAEIYVEHPGSAAHDPVQISHEDESIAPAWGRTVSLDWTSEKFHVQGWLTEPKDYDATKKYPLIVLVHGGPAAAATSHWGAYGSLNAAAFSALGYFVLQPNPRGSFGQGEEFVQANRRDFGYGDLRDILAGVDAVTARYPVDAERVGLTGWSYGGFMTMFAVTQTHRFRAAVAGAGIGNWQSYYGENSIDQWMLPYFGATVYDDPAVYAKSSAIAYIKNATTPTLVVVGDRDGECPAPQSFEFWHALRARGVDTQLVVYPNEGHGFVDAAHRRDVLLRAAAWMDRYLKADSAPKSGGEGVY